MSETKVQASELSPNKTVDANGWTVYDYGSFKQYKKRGTTTVTVAAAGWTSAYSVGGTLPVGMSTIGTNFVDGVASTGDAAMTTCFFAPPTASTIAVMLSNQYGSALNNQTLHWSLTITTA